MRPMVMMMMMMMMMILVIVVVLATTSSSSSSSGFGKIEGFQSDELLVDDEEFGLEGAGAGGHPITSTSSRRRDVSAADSDSKIQFPLEHAFGPLDSDFSPAGSFSARLKSTTHSSSTVIKLRISRNAFSDVEKELFNKLLRDDDFYRIRLPSNVLSPPGRDFVISSVKARCLPRDGLDEHFFIHVEGANILAVNYGAPGACPFPRQMKLPTKWSFNSHTVLKNSESAPRTPLFAEAVLGGKEVEGEAVKPPERSFWAKYWMYLIPLGLIVMNAITQAMNMPEEQANGQSGAQPAAAVQRGPSSAVRRR